MQPDHILVYLALVLSIAGLVIASRRLTLSILSRKAQKETLAPVPVSSPQPAFRPLDQLREALDSALVARRPFPEDQSRGISNPFQREINSVLIPMTDLLMTRTYVIEDASSAFASQLGAIRTRIDRISDGFFGMFFGRYIKEIGEQLDQIGKQQDRLQLLTRNAFAEIRDSVQHSFNEVAEKLTRQADRSTPNETILSVVTLVEGEIRDSLESLFTVYLPADKSPALEKELNERMSEIHLQVQAALSSRQ